MGCSLSVEALQIGNGKLWLPDSKPGRINIKTGMVKFQIQFYNSRFGVSLPLPIVNLFGVSI